MDVLVGRPTITLQKSAVNTPLVTLATKFNPVGNLVFTRDQQITTAKGVVLGHLNSPQREAETLIAKLCWEELGVPLVGDVRSSGGGRLEGGDFIPINADVCYIGIGLRTNIEAVEYMMKHDLFGTTRVAVVRCWSGGGLGRGVLKKPDHQPPTANRQPPTANRHQAPMPCGGGVLGRQLPPENFVHLAPQHYP